MAHWFQWQVGQQDTAGSSTKGRALPHSDKPETGSDSSCIFLQEPVDVKMGKKEDYKAKLCSEYWTMSCLKMFKVATVSHAACADFQALASMVWAFYNMYILYIIISTMLHCRHNRHLESNYLCFLIYVPAACWPTTRTGCTDFAAS